MSLRIEKYSDEFEKAWDTLVLRDSINGTFLQSRNFINYHTPGKFKDCSLCVFKGNDLVGAILACEVEDEGNRTFFSHKGTSYGGIIVSKKIYQTSAIAELMELFEEYLKNEGFEKVYLKMTPSIYQKQNADALDYFLYKSGYKNYNELNFYMQVAKYKEDVISVFSSSKRRDYRYSLKNNLEFKELFEKQQIAEYYEILLKNLKKLGAPVVHSLDDLLDLKTNRIYDFMRFYGVYFEGKMIAGSVVFIINDDIFHTQYLSSDEEYLKIFPMDFLITNLIQTAVNEKKRLFSFGICTEDQGRYLNLGLSRFKEGFGTEYALNISYEKYL